MKKENKNESLNNGNGLHPLLGAGFIDTTVLDSAISKWGEDVQVEMIIEECLELALSLQRLKRKRGNFNEKYHVIDKIADVKIMITQAERIFDSKGINARIDYKMNRLKERLIEGVC